MERVTPELLRTIAWNLFRTLMKNSRIGLWLLLDKVFPKCCIFSNIEIQSLFINIELEFLFNLKTEMVQIIKVVDFRQWRNIRPI